MHRFLQTRRESSDLLRIAIAEMAFSIYLFTPYVPECLLNLSCLIPLAYNSFFSKKGGFRPEICIAWCGEKWFSVWQPRSCARRRGLGNIRERSSLQQNTDTFKQPKYRYEVGLFLVPVRWRSTTLARIRPVFLQNYNVRLCLMNTAFRPRHLQSEISVSSEMSWGQN